MGYPKPETPPPPLKGCPFQWSMLAAEIPCDERRGETRDRREAHANIPIWRRHGFEKLEVRAWERGAAACRTRSCCFCCLLLLLRLACRASNLYDIVKYVWRARVGTIACAPKSPGSLEGRHLVSPGPLGTVCCILCARSGGAGGRGGEREGGFRWGPAHLEGRAGWKEMQHLHRGAAQWCLARPLGTPWTIRRSRRRRLAGGSGDRYYSRGAVQQRCLWSCW